MVRKIKPSSFWTSEGKIHYRWPVPPVWFRNIMRSCQPGCCLDSENYCMPSLLFNQSLVLYKVPEFGKPAKCCSPLHLLYYVQVVAWIISVGTCFNGQLPSSSKSHLREVSRHSGEVCFFGGACALYAEALSVSHWMDCSGTLSPKRFSIAPNITSCTVAIVTKECRQNGKHCRMRQ